LTTEFIFCAQTLVFTYTFLSIAPQSSSHGFGLPHTDEDPYNENQGNCLDYTKDPGGGGNLYPGAVNMKKLKNMYLSRRKLSSVESEDGSIIETHMLVVDPSLIEDYDTYEEV
jgi:hypothetical protein